MEIDDVSSNRPRKRTKLTVYDAVAGRANYEGFLSAPKNSKYRDRASTTSIPIPPEEVLFRGKNAPVRYEENDIYFADRHLDHTDELQRLPDSDLLKALHAYASDFYARVSEDGDDDYGSLDETALLALGILVEEAAALIRVDDVASLPVDLGSTAESDETKVRSFKVVTDSDGESVRGQIRPESDEESVGHGIKREADE